MAKYNYDKKALKGLTPFPFLGEVKTRTAAIEAAPATLPKSVYNPNILAASRWFRTRQRAPRRWPTSGPVSMSPWR